MYGDEYGQYIVGHRGAKGLAPENTLRAFEVGVNSNAEVLECDVHLTKDKKIVVFHDNTLNRTTNGTGWIKDYSLKELKNFNVGDSEKIPTLREVLDLVTTNKKKLIIEMKGESQEILMELAERLTEFLKSSKVVDQVIVHSFWAEPLRHIKRIYPEVKTVLVMMVGLPAEKLVGLVASAQADGMSIAYDYVSEKLIRLARSKNFTIDAWVLNDETTFNHMKRLGVNGLITDYPTKFKL